ncbi:MAG: ABZJ_00895 family protein [Rhizobiaceae bacterium]
MQTTTPSMGSSVFAFTAMFIVLAILINIILWALMTYAGMSPESGTALGWMPVVLAPMIAGQGYGKKAGAKPAQSYSWLFGFISAVITIATIVLAWVLFARMLGIDGMAGSFEQIQREIGVGVFWAVVAGFFILIWVLQRFGFSFGAGQSVKLAERTKT